jgi:hypothetical protein
MRLRLFLVVIAGWLVSACALAPETASVGVGTGAYTRTDAKPFATLYLPYAELAQLAYDNDQGICPAAAPAGWVCKWGLPDFKICPEGRDCAPGLGFHVWVRNGPRGCQEAAIVFRGTDWGELGDMLSNFRWFWRTSQADEYEQVKFAIKTIVSRTRAACPNGVIVAVGHSLGGGLAQFAAYLDRRIRYVYAFNPSPVTAFLSVPDRAKLRQRTLGIDRVYEAGEILSLPRYLASGIFPTSSCRPYVRIVRFNVFSLPGLLKRHSIAVLAEGFRKAASVPPPLTPKQLPYGFRDAGRCIVVIGGPGGEG